MQESNATTPSFFRDPGDPSLTPNSFQTHESIFDVYKANPKNFLANGHESWDFASPSRHVENLNPQRRRHLPENVGRVIFETSVCRGLVCDRMKSDGSCASYPSWWESLRWRCDLATEQPMHEQRGQCTAHQLPYDKKRHAVR